MQKIILDVVPNGIEPRVYVNQFDTGRTFQIAFKENFGSYYFPNDVVFRINGRKADNHIFEYSEADKWDATHYVITKSGSGDALVVTIATTEQMTAAAGETKVQLTFKSSSASNDILGTLNFILAVQEQPYANGDPSGSDFPEIIAMATEQMETAEAYAKGTRNGSAVTSGDPAYHNNSKYYSEQASSSATTAGNAATTATTKADEASASATTATNAKNTAVDAATRAEAIEAHPPRLDPPGVTPNGNWWVWDNTLNPPAYKDSGVDAGVSCDVDPNTVTLPAGSSATVQNTGTQTDPRFKFSIPQGPTGNTGATPNITMTASADAQSSQNPTVTVTKTGTDEEPNFALAFSGLKGAKGDAGPVGPAGDIADIEEAVGWTGANLFEGLDEVNVFSGITITRQNDKKYLVSGTKSGTSGSIYRVGTFTCKAGVEYKVSGCPTGGGAAGGGFWLGVYSVGGSSAIVSDTGTGATITAFAQDTEIELGIRIAGGYVCPSNFLWDVMISRNGGEYVPYHPTVQQELWDGEVAEPKNVLENHALSQTKDNVTFVVNDTDKTITANGTAASPAVQYATIPITDGIVPNTFLGLVLTGCENGTSETYNYNVQYFNTPSTLDTWDIVYGTTPYAIKNYPYIRILARVTAGAQVTNAKWSPMLCTLEDWNKSHAYSPYYVPLKDVVPTKFSSSNVAPTEDGAGVSQAYSTGQYLIHNGELRKATTAIASGAAITDNNTDATTLAEILELNKNELASGIATLNGDRTVFDYSNATLTCVVNRFTRRISIQFSGVEVLQQLYVRGAFEVMNIATGYWGLISPWGSALVSKDNTYYRAQIVKTANSTELAIVAQETIPAGAVIGGYLEWPY